MTPEEKLETVFDLAFKALDNAQAINNKLASTIKLAIASFCLCICLSSVAISYFYFYSESSVPSLNHVQVNSHGSTVDTNVKGGGKQ